MSQNNLRQGVKCLVFSTLSMLCSPGLHNNQV